MTRRFSLIVFAALVAALFVAVSPVAAQATAQTDVQRYKITDGFVWTACGAYFNVTGGGITIGGHTTNTENGRFLSLSIFNLEQRGKDSGGNSYLFKDVDHSTIHAYGDGEAMKDQFGNIVGYKVKGTASIAARQVATGGELSDPKYILKANFMYFMDLQGNITDIQFQKIDSGCVSQ